VQDWPGESDAGGTESQVGKLGEATPPERQMALLRGTALSDAGIRRNASLQSVGAELWLCAKRRPHALNNITSISPVFERVPPGCIMSAWLRGNRVWGESHGLAEQLRG
jgi:hypothetical protein